ncbi:dihydroorotase [Candidatus Poriferisocius sp.]|uniref:dihydroorotase n=1 Tax=Candidatus Poriferisocius sp. TaxID=3101276 RepID=UPI003B5C131F
MTFDLVVRGGTVVTAGGRKRADVYVRNGLVAAVLEPGQAEAADVVVEADGRYVLPGMVDTHVHLMEPGDPTREDFPTGTRAAVRQGVTTIVEHTHSWPLTNTGRFEEKWHHIRGRSFVDYAFAAHVFPDHVGNIRRLWEAGVVFFKIFTCATHGIPAVTPEILLEVFQELSGLGAPCLVHCEDDLMTARNERRLKAEGRVDPGIVPEWRSREAELVAVGSAALLAKVTGARATVAHASSADVVDLIQRERAAGSPIAAETCPQYLYLFESEIHQHGPFRKFTPPARIRSAEEQDRMWTAFNNGWVNHLSTDHAPSTVAQKMEGSIWECHFGLPGLDTTMPLMIDAALSGRTSLERLVEAYAERPAERYGLRGKGRIAVGFDADLVVVDPSAKWQIHNDHVVSRAGWTPYAGRDVRGRVEEVLLRGRVVEDGAPTRGRFIPGPGSEPRTSFP